MTEEYKNKKPGESGYPLNFKDKADIIYSDRRLKQMKIQELKNQGKSSPESTTPKIIDQETIDNIMGDF